MCGQVILQMPWLLERLAALCERARVRAVVFVHVFDVPLQVGLVGEIFVGAWRLCADEVGA
jgi:hypothetical protein